MHSADNFCSITLLSIISKLFTRLLNNRLCNREEEYNVYVEAQGGSRKGRGTTDSIFVLTSLMQILQYWVKIVYGIKNRCIFLRVIGSCIMTQSISLQNRTGLHKSEICCFICYLERPGMHKIWVIYRSFCVFIQTTSIRLLPTRLVWLIERFIQSNNIQSHQDGGRNPPIPE